MVRGDVVIGILIDLVELNHTFPEKLRWVYRGSECIQAGYRADQGIGCGGVDEEVDQEAALRSGLPHQLADTGDHLWEEGVDFNS